MGLAPIVQSNISEHSQSLWSKVGPKLPDIPIDTSKYNRGFVNFFMLVGLYASVHLGVKGVKKLHKALKSNKALPKAQFLQRYGEGSWAVIADVAYDEDYCLYLARQGLNLILMGDEGDIKIVDGMIQVAGSQVKTISYPVDWSKGNFDYQQFVKKVKDYDISFLILPKMQQVRQSSSFGTHLETIPPYEHFYLLVRYLGPLLQWRSYQSAIILPSSTEIDKLKTGHGVRQGIISALDSFMRTLNFQLRNSIDVITNRGTVQQCFKDLGKQSISQ